MPNAIDPKEELIIISHVTGVDVQSIQMGCFQPSKDQDQEIQRLVKKRQMNEPLDYVLGQVSFFDVTLKVNPHVLIPRPETELLVEMAINEIPKGQEGSVLDLCTGSGCIGIAVKNARPKLCVTLSDISQEAIDVAQNNAKLNKLDVSLARGHLFDSVSGQKFDYLFCNPPYIPEREYLELDKSVKDHEPKLALTGGEDGLLFYRMIEKNSKNYLNSCAKCYFEIGYDQGEAVLDVFSDGVWRNKRVLKDYAGHDRFFLLEFAPEDGVK